MKHRILSAARVFFFAALALQLTFVVLEMTGQQKLLSKFEKHLKKNYSIF